MNSPPKLILRFFLGFMVLYALVLTPALIPWPGFRSAYRAFYCWMGNMVFGSIGETGSVRFAPWETPQGDLDTTLVLTNTKPPAAVAEIHKKSVILGYYPTASFVALVLATPIPWRWRRCRALLWGLVWVNLFVLVRTGIEIVQLFSGQDALNIFDLGRFGRAALDQAHAALVGAPASFFVVPIFIWILVTFRRTDWQAFTRGTPPDS
jgi:hypothetical protein